MFFNLNNKLNKNEKLDFLEYLSFQIKADLSFEKILKRYIESGIRNDKINILCLNAITDIQNGETPADALYHNSFINKTEYGIFINATDTETLYTSIVSIINLNKNNLKNKNILNSSITSGLATFSAVFMVIPFFQDDIISLYGTFGEMQNLAKSDASKNLELPFLVKYWWASFLLIGVIVSFFAAMKIFFMYLYRHHTDVYYRIFKNVLYQDLVSVLRTFIQIKTNMSISNTYKALSSSSPNPYWENLFESVYLNLQQGGRASEIFVSHKGVLPLEIINNFVDADETGEVQLYLNKSLEYCESKNETINRFIKEWAPTVINIILLLTIGVLIVAFMEDIMQNGLLDVMNKM